MTTGLLLIAHGTVDDLADLPAFLANIRRGHAPSDELVAEVRRRYEAIGGRSPLNATCHALARAVSVSLGVPARACARLWRPTAADALGELVAEGCSRVVVLPLAQYSASVYAEAVLAAAAAMPEEVRPAIVAVPDWGQDDALLALFAARIREALEPIAPSERARTELWLSAHSLPKAVVASGDRYEIEFRAAAAGVVARLEAEGPIVGRTRVVFQSQGMSAGPGGRPIEWLGPTLVEAMDEAKAAGSSRVVVAPIGFLADHVEILYDLDLEAKAQAEERGLTLTRTRSLDADPAFVSILARLAEHAIGHDDA